MTLWSVRGGDGGLVVRNGTRSGEGDLRLEGGLLVTRVGVWRMLLGVREVSWLGLQMCLTYLGCGVWEMVGKDVRAVTACFIKTGGHSGILTVWTAALAKMDFCQGRSVSIWFSLGYMGLLTMGATLTTHC